MSFNASIQKMELILTYSGLTLNSRYIDSKTKWRNRFLFIFNLFWFNTDAIAGVLWMVKQLKDGSSIGEITYMAPCATLTYLSIVKSLIFIYNEDYICDLVTNLKNLDVKFNKTYRDVDFLHTVLRASKILNAMLGVVFSWSTLVVSLIFYARDGVFEVIFPLKVEYPLQFDYKDYRIWPFVYIHQFWSVCLVLLNILGPDYLLYICCTYLKVHFLLLSEEFQATINKYCCLPENEFDKKCTPLIQWHQLLIELAQNLEVVYTKSTLSNYVSSSILICLTGFNVVSMNNAAATVMFLVFLSANLAQIFLLCYFGDLVMKSSMEVSAYIYNSQWYKVHPKAVKNLLIVHIRSLKPCKLTAFGFSDVSLKSFMSILSSAWSYFALLKTVTTPNKI